MPSLRSFGAVALQVAVLLTAACAATPTQQVPGELFDDGAWATRIKSARLDDPHSGTLATKVASAVREVGNDLEER